MEVLQRLQCWLIVEFATFYVVGQGESLVRLPESLRVASNLGPMIS